MFKFSKINKINKIYFFLGKNYKKIKNLKKIIFEKYKSFLYFINSLTNSK